MKSQNNLRMIVIAVVGCVAAGVPTFIVYDKFLSPLWALQRDLTKAQGELDAEQKKLDEFNEKKRKLERARLISLPAGVSEGVTKYNTYLKDLARYAGLTNVDITDPNMASEAKQQTGKKLQAGHVVRAWTVRAKTDWPSLITFLEKFQRTPLLHRIKHMQIERPMSSSEAKYSGQLVLTMTIEAMVVHGSEKTRIGLWGFDPRLVRADIALAGMGQGQLPFGWSMILRPQALMIPASPPRRNNRSYEILGDYWDPFLGGKTEAQKKKEAEDLGITPRAKDNGEGDDSEFGSSEAAKLGMDVTPYWRLTMTWTDKDKEACLRNFLEEDVYVTLSLSQAAGKKDRYNTFQVLGEKKPGQKRPVQVRAKILHIEQRAVYFIAEREKKDKTREKRIYRIDNGQSVKDALENPLTPADLQQLDWFALPPLGASTLGLLACPQAQGAWLAALALYPDRPGMRNGPEAAQPPQSPVEIGGKTDRIE